MQQRLKKIREDMGKTQKEMSAFLGLGEITWQNYERGISKPKLATLEKLAKLGYNIAWITTGSGEIFSSLVAENSNTAFNKTYSIDKSKIFNMLLKELKDIYSSEDLILREDSFLSNRAFDITMSIERAAQDDIEALSMLKIMLLAEADNKKI